MSDPAENKSRRLAWRILRIVLPLMVLATGFFGVQIWMVWDEQQRAKPEIAGKQITLPSSAKADVARLAGSSEAESPVVPQMPSLQVKAPESGNQAISATLPGITYYRLQAGSFEDSRGAEKLRLKLSELGYGSVVVPAEGRNKVVLMLFFSQDQVKRIRTDIESVGVSGYAEKFSVPAALLMLRSDSRRLQDFVNGTLIELPELLRELCDHYYLYELQGMDPAIHKGIMLKQLSRLSDMRTAVENMTVAKEDQPLQRRLAAYLDGYIRYMEKAEKVTGLDRNVLWPGLMEQIEAYQKLGQE